ncbi:MAG: hypothetical protein EA409_06780 [Saprospirales bacterium]|nr:MAG: hypothetical protein EA409_06780 [Saprospirales bacterium]
MQLKVLTISLVFLLFSNHVFGWAEHPLLVQPILEKLDYWETVDSVEIKSLVSFIEANAGKLYTFLEEHEKWASENLCNYRYRPHELRLDTFLRGEELRTGFLMAIRVNPNSKLPLYLHLLPGDSVPIEQNLSALEVSVFDNLKRERNTRYRKLFEGALAHPLDVLVSANDEPDYGLDIGLFEDNGTPYGEIYGFGNQPFGNPNLPYSSQAPFHMSFYHEPGLVYRFMPGLNNSLLESRLFLFRALSLFSFSQGEDYWGWRFLGWSMHYATDLTMPYHSTALPGFSTLQMIMTQLNAWRGNEGGMKDIIQLVSNRHTVLEAYQWLELKSAHERGLSDHDFLQAFSEEVEVPDFTLDFARKTASRAAYLNAQNLDKALRMAMPELLVDDPGIEVRFKSELREVDRLALQHAGAAKIEYLNREIADRFRDASAVVLSLFYSVIDGVDPFEIMDK